MKMKGLEKQTFLKEFRQNICNDIAINANFHFSDFESMEIATKAYVQQH